MDLKAVFELIGHITSQTNTKDLSEALRDVLANNFSGAQVVVYEVQGSRSGQSGRHCIVGLDMLQLKAPMYLHQHDSVMEAFQTKSVVSKVNSLGNTQLILPIELYDKTISHMVVSSYPKQTEGTLDIYQGFLKIFADIFRNLHEKSYDPLTRILNRQAFDQTITKLAYSSEKEPNLALYSKDYGTIAILDIDNFKKINDQFGHSIGDETLVLFSQTIRSVLRQEDMFFRYGGEEFVIFVKETDSLKALKIIERCRHAIESRRFPQVDKVTVSIGIAKLQPHKEHPSDSLSKADKALYHIKKTGRNQVGSYDNLIEAQLIKPLDLHHEKADFWE